MFCKSNGETLQGKDPGTYGRIVEIKSGRADVRQRLTATCKDLSK